MNIQTLGIDIAKNVFQLHGVNRSGYVESEACQRIARIKGIGPKTATAIAPHYDRVTPDRCLQRTKADLFQNRLAKGEPSIEVENAARMPSFSSVRLTGRADCPTQPDNLGFLGYGVSHSSSSPSPITFFLSRRFSRVGSATTSRRRPARSCSNDHAGLPHVLGR